MNIEIGTYITQYATPLLDKVRSLAAMSPIGTDLTIIAVAVGIGWFLSEKIVTRFTVWLVLSVGLYLLLRFV